jgi:hypothetical protein
VIPKAWHCSTSFGASWKDTVQMSSTVLVLSTEPAFGSDTRGIGQKWKSVISWLTERPSSSRSLRQRIWEPRLSVGSLKKWSFYLRLTGDMSLRIVLLLAVSFASWSAGEGGGAIGRELRAWEAWRQYESPVETGADGNYYGRFFRQETEAEISAWWKELERGINAPATIEGGFT